MGLQAQSRIGIFMRDRQNPLCQRQRIDDPTGADVVLIDSIDRSETAALFAVLFGEFARPAIRFSDRRRNHPLGTDRGHPQRQLHVDFERVTLRSIGQRPQQEKPPLQVCDCFDMSRTRRRKLPGLQPLPYGAFSISGACQMMGQKGVPLFIEELTKAVLESADREGQLASVLAASPASSLGIPATLPRADVLRGRETAVLEPPRYRRAAAVAGGATMCRKRRPAPLHA
jgi:hypothetical protein